MKNNTIRRVILLGALAIILVITTQTYWVMRSWDLTSQKFDQTANIALLNVAKDISQLNQTILPQSNLIKQLSSNSYAVNVNSQIDARNLDFYLKKNFDQFSLNEDYDYAIYDCHDEKMVYGRYVSYSALTDSVSVKKEFPKLDNPTATYYFIVRFPKRTSSLVASMSLTIVFTLISLLTVIFFIYALSVITRQKRLSELQRDFINNMTHEFKTPIATISLATDSITSPSIINNPDKIRRFAGIITAENKRMNGQVEKVLQMAQLDRDAIHLNVTQVDLHEIIEHAIDNISLQVSKRDGTVTSDLKAQDPMIEGDQNHIANILNNLLDNANKYSTDRPIISVTTASKPKGVEVTVTDNGMGINKESQKQIFDKFYRVHTGNVHDIKGFGLGLAYVKALVTAHNGTINLKSDIGKGSSFTLFFPYKLP